METKSKLTKCWTLLAITASNLHRSCSNIGKVLQNLKVCFYVCMTVLAGSAAKVKAISWFWTYHAFAEAKHTQPWRCVDLFITELRHFLAFSISGVWWNIHHWLLFDVSAGWAFGTLQVHWMWSPLLFPFLSFSFDATHKWLCVKMCI